MHQKPEVSLEKVTQTMANYQFEFDHLVERYRSAAPQASCLVMLPPDVAPPREDVPCRKEIDMGGEEPVCIPPTLRNYTGIVAVQKATARRHGCAVWDQSHAMGGEGSIQRWAHLDPQLARTDGVHMTMDGYHLLAEAFFSDLMRSYALWKAGGHEPLKTRPIERSTPLNAARPPDVPLR
jgi:lysophospholipase L1-like esterase